MGFQTYAVESRAFGFDLLGKDRKAIFVCLCVHESMHTHTYLHIVYIYDTKKSINKCIDHSFNQNNTFLSINR